MAVTIYYEQDAPIGALEGKKVAVVGYGSQGHAHSLNLRDSGIDVAVAELEGTDNFKLAVEHGFKPTDIRQACDGATLIEPLHVPRTARERMHGLRGRAGLADAEGMWFPHRRLIHTFGMQFPIDLVYLGADYAVCKVVHGLRPSDNYHSPQCPA